MATWDYLIVTASNEAQGAAYERLLAQRHLPDFHHTLVVTDPGGKRIGSGGSTLLCIMKIVASEHRPGETVLATLRRLRIMIIHAGGDSRRLPAYGPCGKIFIPLPDTANTLPAPTLFDSLLPSFLALPEGKPGAGQVLVASGDVLLRFDAASVRLDFPGLVALACREPAEQAAKHGVFVADGSTVRAYLQKPSLAEQQATGALDAKGRAALDIGVMSFDAGAILALLTAFEVGPTQAGALDWSPAMKERIFTLGLDLYREICCAPGTEADRSHYFRAAQGSGSTWDIATLDQLYNAIHPIPFHVQVLPHCDFLHFGTTKQLISSGLDLIGKTDATVLLINSSVTGSGKITGSAAWVEGCQISAPLTLSGRNVVIGADIDTPLTLPPDACLDIVPGTDRSGAPVKFVRCYGITDTFKDSLSGNGTFFGRPLRQWLDAVGVPTTGITSLWDAPVFPAVRTPDGFRDWLWMFDVDRATTAQKQSFLAADRYSAAEIVLMTDQDAFHARRTNRPHEKSVEQKLAKNAKGKSS